MENDPLHPPKSDNPYAVPMVDQPLAVSGPSEYHSLPILRKNGFCSTVILCHLAVSLIGACVPFVSLLGIVTTIGVIIVCVTVLTGPIYYNKLTPDGVLQQWSNANKVAAVILLVLFVGGYIAMVYFVAFGQMRMA